MKRYGYHSNIASKITNRITSGTLKDFVFNYTGRIDPPAQ